MTFDNWFHSVEQYGLKSERFYDLVSLHEANPRFSESLVAWLKAAYEAGRKDENEACVDVAKLVAREIDDTNGTATYIADAIRARREQ